MDLDLAPDHVLLRDTIREFMTDEVAPVVDEHERERRFPTDIVRRIGQLGWLGINVPERWGGAGMDTLAYAIAVEEISRIWGSLGIIVAAHTSLGCGPLLVAGTDEQRDRFLPPLASGFAMFVQSEGVSSTVAESIRVEEATGESSEYDTHPPLRERVAALHVFPQGGTGDTRPAVSLLGDPIRFTAANIDQFDF